VKTSVRETYLRPNPLIAMFDGLVTRSREPRLTHGLEGKSDVGNNARGNRERNAAPLRWTVIDRKLSGSDLGEYNVKVCAGSFWCLLICARTRWNPPLIQRNRQSIAALANATSIGYRGSPLS